ncbi:IS66 family insertion sequence element accessory protein TnpA [Marinisporobacter balticus]|uniref:Transposase n=1 Tax=Marinisporobacter balticus TaxID=2018667 RepID=A0A4R2K8T5_9FIRM|nr:hypothetical protein [Marinisporobacter balticus]TCO68512.1 hypothetical protein EV214_1433 [Marinisporobacter balticus]
MAKNSALAEEWAKRIEDCRKSGMSINAWCKQHGLKDSTYHYWVKRLKIFHNPNTVESQQFAEVVLEPVNNRKSFVAPATDYRLSLNCGDYSIGIADNFNPCTLTELLNVLQKL